MPGRASPRRWCRYSLPTAGGKPPVLSAAKCAIRGALCRADISLEWAALVARAGRDGQIMSYVVTIDVLYIGLTGAALFIFRRREPKEANEKFVRVPWHPVTTGVFVLACWTLAVSTLVRYPQNAGIGVGILGVGALVFLFWAKPKS